MARKKKKKKTQCYLGIPIEESATLQDIMNEEKGHKRMLDNYYDKA